jgi:hypothetical protein
VRKALRILLCVAVPLVAVLGWAGSGDGALAAGPRTIADVDGAVSRVAQDETRVAWFFNTHGRDENCDRIRVLNVASGARTTVSQTKDPTAPAEVSCANERNAAALVIAGGRLAWVARNVGNSEYVTLWLASLLAPVSRVILYKAFESWSGTRWVGIAGSGPTLAYGWESFSEPPDCPGPGECGVRRDASPVRLVDADGETTEMPNSDVGNGYGLAASGHAVATSRDSRIVVQDARTGKTLGGARASARPTAFALGQTFVGAVVRSRIEVFDWHTGRRVSRITTPESVGTISMSGARVAYAAGGAIWLLDIADGRARQVAKPRLRPFSVSINGHRIVWAENRLKTDEVTGGQTAVHGYVRFLVIP